MCLQVGLAAPECLGAFQFWEGTELGHCTEKCDE